MDSLLFPSSLSIEQSTIIAFVVSILFQVAFKPLLEATLPAAKPTAAHHDDILRFAVLVLNVAVALGVGALYGSLTPATAKDFIETGFYQFAVSLTGFHAFTFNYRQGPGSQPGSQPGGSSASVQNIQSVQGVQGAPVDPLPALDAQIATNTQIAELARELQQGISSALPSPAALSSASSLTPPVVSAAPIASSSSPSPSNT